MQDFLVEILGKYFKIEKANNGMEALEKLKEATQDSSLLDALVFGGDERVFESE